MRKLLVTAVFAALVAVGLVGCGQSVDEARAEAAARVAQMLYLEDPEAVQAGLENATTVEEIRKLADKAEKEEQERAELYWSCADKAAKVLPGSRWESIAFRPDGSWRRVGLHLEGDDTAALTTLFDSPHATPDQKPAQLEKTDAWLLENTEKVTGWGSDIADRVASRSVLDGQPPHFEPVNKSCTVQFMLTLVTTGGESQFSAKIAFHGSPALNSLVVDGKSLSGKEG